MNPETTTQPNSIVGLLRELKDEAATLLRQQTALAKTELATNVSRLSGHVARIATGGVVALLGATVLLIGLGHLLEFGLIAAGLSEPNARWLGPTLVGLTVAIVGWTMLSSAKKKLADDPIAPRRTIESLKDDQNWIRNKVEHPTHHESTT